MSGSQDDRLGSLLLSHRLVDSESLQRCKTVAQARGCSLSQVLISEGLTTSDQLRQLLAAPGAAITAPATSASPTNSERTEVARTGPERTIVDPMGPSGRQAQAALLSRLGPFEVRGLIAEGGMGMVYRARHDRLQRDCALKVLSPELRLDDETRERFVAEARMAARVGEHPNLVRIFDAGSDEDRVWMAMELVEGTTLQDRVEAKERDAHRDAALLLGVCDALSHVHAHGIIHRDLKPPNVLIDREGRPKLSDFGIAKSTTGGGSLTTTGSFLGTPAYMAPEQAEDSRNVDVRSDVYGMGAILYALLCGRAPYVGRSAVNIMACLLNETPPLPSDLVPDVDPALEAVCLRALERDPDDRYADIAELRLALEQALAGSASEAPARRRSSGRLRRASERRKSGSGRVGRGDSGRASRGDSGRQGRAPSQRTQSEGTRPFPFALVAALAGAAALGLLLVMASGGGTSEQSQDDEPEANTAVTAVKVLSFEPAPGTVRGEEVTLRGKVEPKNARLSISARPKGHDGKPPAPRELTATDGSFAGTLLLSDGEWSLKLAAADAPGTVLKGRTITVDGTPPRLDLPELPTLVDLPTLTLTGTLHDASSVSLRVAGHEVPVSPEGGFSHELTLEPGPNTFALVARDVVGNERRRVLELRRELSELTLTLPKQAVRTNKREFQLRSVVRPADAKVEVGGSAVQVDAQGRFERVVSLRPGLNTIDVRATRGEQEARGTVSVELDSEPPRIELLTTSPTRTKDLHLELRFSEPVDGARVVPVKPKAKTSGKEFEASRQASLPILLSEGENALRIEVRDLAGNEGSLEVELRVDSLPPVIEWEIKGSRLRVTATDPSGVADVHLGKKKLKEKKGVYLGYVPKEKTEIVAVDALGNEARTTVTPGLYYLQDRERWAKAAASDQDREIKVVAKLLGKGFVHLNTRTYTCAGSSHRLAAFRHAPTKIELLLVPGGNLSMGLSPREFRAELDKARESLRAIFPEDQLASALATALLTAETPQRAVRIAPFLIGRTEVTVAEFERGGFSAPTFPNTSPAQPVTAVSWDLAKRFTAKNGLRLPSEAEWEYACKAGSTSRYYWGDTFQKEFVSSPVEPPQFFPPPLPVGRRRKEKRWNAFGLLDMSGNASEWCEDPFTWAYPGGQGVGLQFPWRQLVGLSPTNKDRVVRGGNRCALEDRMRSTARFFSRPDDGPPAPRRSIGLRVVRSLSAKAKRQR